MNSISPRDGGLGAPIEEMVVHRAPAGEGAMPARLALRASNAHAALTVLFPLHVANG